MNIVQYIYMQKLKEQMWDELCCPLLAGCSMWTSPSSAKTRARFFSEMETFYGRHCCNQPKARDWQMKCVCGDIQMYFMATVDIQNRWRINTELVIELWNSSDMPTISKCDQGLFLYHAAKVPNCNWIISFYNRLGAVVWPTFDLYCIIRKSVWNKNTWISPRIG